MDNVSHALAGCLMAAATVALVERRTATTRPSFRTAAVVVGVVAAELPDSDLVYARGALGMGKLGYLLHHRGHTHTVIFALISAVLLWALVIALRRELRGSPERGALLGLALAGTLSHLLLDFTNSYGIHPFWPVESSWYYGDAIFIIEPWLWVASIPPLIFLARKWPTRLLFGVLLAGILAAAWMVDLVSREVATALTVATVLWLAVARLAPMDRRAALGIAAWLGVEGVFFGASFAARREVIATVGARTYRDVVLNPAVGNPFCFGALLVEADGATYRVTTATVAPFRSLRSTADCRSTTDRSSDIMTVSARPATPALIWYTEWSAPREELRGLIAGNCELSRAMQFMRVPVWRRVAGDSIEFADLRFGEGGRGFATFVSPLRKAECPGPAPGWTFPRADLLERNGS